MKLGRAAQIAIGVPNLAETLPFYEKFGFMALDKSDKPHPWARFTDGRIVIQLEQGGMSQVSLSYSCPDLPEIAAELEAMGISFSLKPKNNAGQSFDAVLKDPDGFTIGLINQEAQPIADIRGESISRAGDFGEFSLPVKDLQAAVKFWEQIGFERTGGDDADSYPWAIVVDELMVIGLHQTTDFDAPTITYFATDMAARIKALREDGLEPAWIHENEAGETVSARFKAPDGMDFFLFWTPEKVEVGQ